MMSPGSKFFDPGRVGSAIYGLGFEFGKSPLKMSNLSILFPLGQKVPGSKAGRPLIYCGSKVSLDWVRAHLYFNHDLVQARDP